MEAMLGLHPAALCAQQAGGQSNRDKLLEKDKQAAAKITTATEKAKSAKESVEGAAQDATKGATETVKKATIKRNNALTRGYHNFTGYFNVYFNAYDSYREAMKIVEKKYRYDYANILPVFPFADDSIPPLVQTQLARTMEKSNKTIKQHSITTKPTAKKGGRMTKKEQAFYNKREYCIWVSEAVFLIGMSNIYLQEYTLARMAFAHVASEYPEDANSYRSRIWLGILEGAADNVSGQENALTPLLTDRHFPKEHLILRSEAMADLMIRKKDYAKAITHLEQALDKRWKPEVVRRYHYILGQLYQQRGNYPAAAKHYRRVMRSFAPEKMRINATINYSYLADGRSDNMRQTLIDMSQNEKYEDYYDMIYFALAELETRAKNEEQAADYYRLAIQHNKGGNATLLMSANYKLALYFERTGRYEEAQTHYSRVAELMPPSDPDYKSVQNKAKNLTRLARSLRAIRLQDSLQRIAQMTDSERAAYVERCIARSAADQANRERQAQIAAQSPASAGSPAEAGRGAWYFYNAAVAAKGREEFRKIWGERPLADNWRFAPSGADMLDAPPDPDPEASPQTPPPTPAAQTSPSAPLAAPAANADKCLKGVPFTPEAMAASHDSLAAAMMDAAKTYRNYLADNKSAIAMLENLLRRYPVGEHRMEAYFYLYALYLEEKNPKLSDEYKQKLIEAFPDSDVAQSLQNPNYASKTELVRLQADTLFEQAYTLYTKQQYPQALQAAQEGLARYRHLDIVSKFALLQAMAKGSQTNMAGHIYNLQLVISEYPNTDAAKAAQDMIDHLQVNEAKIVQQQAEAASRDSASAADGSPEGSAGGGSGMYNAEEGRSFFVIAFDPRAVNLNQLRFDITAFNTYRDIDLAIETQPLSMSLNVMKLGVFQRTAAAMEYYRAAKALPDLAAHKDIIIFVITEQNFEALMKERYLSGYIDFFKKNMDTP